MDNIELRIATIKACKQYFSYLESTESGGMSIIDVFHIQQMEIATHFFLNLRGKLRMSDSYIVRVKGVLHPEIEIKQYHSQDKTLNSAITIDIPTEMIPEFIQLRPFEVSIVSDLKFLIKRLDDYFSHHKIHLLPGAPLFLPELPQSFLDGMSRDQLNAYQGVLRHPVSYVWGAPGTGKTRMVLSRCILRYVLNKKRVLLLAPTNNAIEQVLYGVLPVIKDAGVDLKQVYRLGTASSEFSEQYPEVVGDRDLEAKLSQLNSELSSVKKQIDDISAFNFKAKALEKESNEIHSSASIVLSMCDLLTLSFQDLEQSKMTLSQAVATRASYQSQVKLLEADLMKKSARLDSCEKAIDQNNTQIAQWRFVFWKRKDIAKLREENKLLFISLSTLKDEVAQAQENLDGQICFLKEAVLSLESNEREVEDKENAYEAIFHTILEKIASPKIAELYKGNLGTPSLLPSAITTFVSEVDCTLEAFLSQSPSSDLLPHLQSRYSELSASIEKLSENSKIRQKEKALVIAGTFDSTISSLPIPQEDKQISHVFIDEAGYTSIVRGMVAFTLKCPVSFFGDHMQLPPVCEANRIRSTEQEMSLFALPIPLYPALCLSSMDDVFKSHYVGQTYLPPSQLMPVFPLNYSYRFGDKLAQLLAQHFYQSSFRGDPSTDFSIQVLNAPRQMNDEARSNRGEAYEIMRYVLSHPDEDLVILSPYRAQIKLISKIVSSRKLQTEVLTVHKSQGREWDTVIFSVVDTKRKFLVDSSIPQGRQVLNTAISRARKKLIIACDVAYWQSQNNQIVRKLIELSDSSSKKQA